MFRNEGNFKTLISLRKTMFDNRFVVTLRRAHTIRNMPSLAAQT